VDEMLLQDVEVVAVGVQRRDATLGSLRPRVPVIVVTGDARDLGLAEDPERLASWRRRP
jgi:hypothetical protein